MGPPWFNFKLCTIYLLAITACGVPPAIAQQANFNVATLYSFPAYDGDGSNSRAGLILDSSGALYGTTTFGGANGAGTVFKLARPAIAGGTWAETLLHNFGAIDSFGRSDGSAPIAGLIAGASGALYSSTYHGGTGPCRAGCGTVFMLSPEGAVWAETVLHYFVPSPADGYLPNAVISDASGVLYGTTALGGATGSGTVFELTPPSSAGGAWTFTILYSFNPNGNIPGGNTGDGYGPAAGLISDESGALYGTTANGGANGYGTVFKLTPPAAAGGSWTETVLYSFTGGSDGGSPEASLIFDASGALYSTTTVGGLYGQGTVFTLTPPRVRDGAWTETVLYSFAGLDSGAAPSGASLIIDSSGALYGTTLTGGANGLGTVFKLAPPARADGTWVETVLYSFTGGNDGSYPFAGLIADASGSLYGTTSQGGANGGGTVFQLTSAVSFVGTPGEPNCVGQSVSTIAKSFGGISSAAVQFGYPDVQALEDAVKSYCAG